MENWYLGPKYFIELELNALWQLEERGWELAKFERNWERGLAIWLDQQKWYNEYGQGDEVGYSQLIGKQNQILTPFFNWLDLDVSLNFLAPLHFRIKVYK